MINNKFLFFKTRESFDKHYRWKDINPESIVFIKGETPADRAIWTHNVFYLPSTGLEHSKGFFESYESLVNTYPWPVAGDWAIIATESAPWVFSNKLPATFSSGGSNGDWVICTCEQDGKWIITNRPYNHEGIDLSEYLKRDEIDLSQYVRQLDLDLDDYLTKTEASSVYASKAQVESKQDKLVSGVNIRTINDQSLLGSGNIPIVQVINMQGGGGDTTSSVNLTQIQADIQMLKDFVNRLNISDDDQNYIYLAFLTLEQYDALDEYDENTLYFIVLNIPTRSWTFGSELPVVFNE